MTGYRARAFAVGIAIVAALVTLQSTLAVFMDVVFSGDTGVEAGTILLTVNGDSACAARGFGGTPDNPGPDGNTGCDVAAGTFSGNGASPGSMRPGETVSGSFTASNAGLLDGLLSVGPGGIAVSGGKGSCGTENLVVSTGLFDATLPTGSTEDIPVGVTLASNAADGCQGATFTVDIPFELSYSGSTAFEDEVRSAGNTFVADTLPAPVGFTATSNGTGTEVALAWSPGTGDFSTSWEIARASGAACSGWTPGAANLVTGLTATSYTDTNVAQGETYCYAVRGVNGTWRSLYTVDSTSTPAPVRLYFHDTTGGNNVNAKRLVTANPTGFERFGCLLTALGACIDVPRLPTSYTMTSDAAFRIPSAAGWSAQIRYSVDLAINVLTGRDLELTVWRVPNGSTCGTPPSSASGALIATGTFDGDDLLLSLVIGAQSTAQIPLAADPNFVAPDEPATVCTRMALIGGTALGIASYFNIHNGPDTWIQGAYE